MSCTPQILPEQRTHTPEVLPFTPIPVGKTLTVDQVRQIPELHTSAEILVAAPGFAGTARYTYDRAATLPDDGAAVLKPSWVLAGQPGRWLREELGGLGTHLTDPDPHPQYTTTSEVAAEIANHEASADPHSQYQREIEKGVAGGYASLDGGGKVPDSQIPDTITRDTELAAHEGAADPHTVYQKESEKGSANGYASLDAGGTVPDAQIPAGIARDSEVTTAIGNHEGAVDPHTQYERESQKGIANGYASLDGGGKVPDSQIPDGITRDTELVDFAKLAGRTGGQTLNGGTDAGDDLTLKSTGHTSPGTIFLDDPTEVKLGTSSQRATVGGRITTDLASLGNTTNGEDTLNQVTIPNGAFQQTGRAVRLTAWGNTGAGGMNKDIKLYFGGKVVCNNDVTLAPASKKWRASATIHNNGTDIQKYEGLMQVGSVQQSVNEGGATEDDGADIICKVTATVAIPGGPNEVKCEGLMVEWLA